MGSKLKDEEFNNILVLSLLATWDTIMMSYLGNAMLLSRIDRFSLGPIGDSKRGVTVLEGAGF